MNNEAFMFNAPPTRIALRYTYRLTFFTEFRIASKPKPATTAQATRTYETSKFESTPLTRKLELK